MVNILIESSNITHGGGLTHLVNLINNFDSIKFPTTTLYVFAPNETLQKLGDKPWIVKVSDEFLNSNLLSKLYWRIFILPKKIKELKINIVFAPGGLFIGNLGKVVTMSQNMLVFEAKERRRFHVLSWSRLRLKILNYVQSYIFKKVGGLIFISHYAKKYITQQLNMSDNFPVIYHGIEERFISPPHKQLPISSYSFKKPFKLLYTSIVDVYKHQWILVEACSILREEGLPIELNLIGGDYPPALKKLKWSINKFDPRQNFIFYHGKVEFEKIDKFYVEADGFIFASTCENMPNIVVEAMASGLPILSSSFGPMPEIVGEKTMTFDPTSVESAVESIRTFLYDTKARQLSVEELFKKAQIFSWKKCSDETFQYILEVANKIQ